METTTTRITWNTLRLLRMLKAMENRDQIEIIECAIVEYVETYHQDELGSMIEPREEEV